MSGLSITRDGRLVMGPSVETVLRIRSGAGVERPRKRPTAAFIWAPEIAAFDSARRARGSVVWSSDQPEIFALAVDARAWFTRPFSSPNENYRIENGRASEYFSPTSAISGHWRWPRRSALRGNGTAENSYSHHRAGQGEVSNGPGTRHRTGVRSAGPPAGGKRANGILYRIAGKGFRTLRREFAAEIRAIVPMADGTVVPRL